MRLLTLQIVLFLTDSNNGFLFIQCSYICLYHFFLRFVFFHLPCLVLLCTRHIHNLTTLFDSNSLQTAFDFIIMNNPGIFRLLSQCISVSLIVKKDILYSNFSFFWMLIAIFSSILFTGASRMSLVFLLTFFHWIQIS